MCKSIVWKSAANSGASFAFDKGKVLYKKSKGQQCLGKIFTGKEIIGWVHKLSQGLLRRGGN